MIINSKAVVTAGAAFVSLVAATPLYAQGKGNDDRPAGASAKQAQRGNSAGQAAGASAGKNDRGGPSANKREAPARGPSEDRGIGNPAKGNPGKGSNIIRTQVGRPGDLGKTGGAGGYALRELRDTFGSQPRLINGCPPGLAKKRNGCLPPGLAQKQYRSFEPGFFGLNRADSGRYLYQDGYLLRYRPDGLAGFLPLLGGALGIGNLWPASYQSAPLPAYYSDYYRLGDDRAYRYADNVIYRVNPETSAITSVAGLLTGDDFAVGSPMPRGYDVYNVPPAYRDRYADTADARYRYADGYVYEIDPASSLIASVIELVL